MKKLVFALGFVVGLINLPAIAADAAGGRAKTTVCAACHGADGNSSVPSFPKLAGQNERYLIKQLKDIKSGARSVPTMAGQLTAMNDNDIANIAAYYAGQTPSGGETKADLLDLGAKVYRAGVAERGVAACIACHSPTGAGNSAAGFPALAGQHADYIAIQLRAFRRGMEYADGRKNDGDTLVMRNIAFGMSDKEIDSVSSYIAGLH
jgi:cytochrome c553